MKKKCMVEERREESRLLFDLQMLFLMEISTDGRYALINYDGHGSTNRNWILLIFKTWDSSIYPIPVEFVNVRSQWMIEKLRTEIGLSPLRSLRDSLNRGERKEGWTYGWFSRTKWRDFCVISLLNFYFLATSPRTLHSLLSTMNDLFFHPFSHVFAALRLLISSEVPSAASTSNVFLTGYWSHFYF